MNSEQINETRSEVWLEGGSKITTCIREYALPNSRGRVNRLLSEELKTRIENGEPVIVFDFSPKEGNRVAGLTEVPKRYAEKTFVFDPLDDRSVSLFGDFAKEGKSNILKLRHLLPLLNAELAEEEVRLKLMDVDEAFKELFSGSQRIQLFELMFAYDQHCFDGLLVKAQVNQELIQGIRKRLAGWFYLFNERSLKTKYLTNYFFIRLLGLGSPWNVTFMFFNLNLQEVCLTDAKWMAEIAIMSRAHAIADSQVRPGIPHRILSSDIENLGNEITMLVRNFYTVDGAYFVLAKEKLAGMSFAQHDQIISSITSDVCETLNVVVIDDDIGLIDVPKTLRNSFVDGYQTGALRTVNIFAQRGLTGGESADDPPTQNQELANALYQLSRLKWGIRRSEAVADQLDFLANISPKFAPFFNFANNTREGQQGDIESALSYKYLLYKNIDDTGNEYPLGNIEPIDWFMQVDTEVAPMEEGLLD